MFDSDDFGIDEDDTAFLAVATQAEAHTDEEGFNSSPRAQKRRRLEDDGRTQNRDSHRQTNLSTRRGVQAKRKSHSVAGYDEDEEGYYLPGELDRFSNMEGNAARTVKKNVHITRNNQDLRSIFVTQTQVDLDEDPTAIRGPIWKKPAAVQGAVVADRQTAMLPPPQPARALGRSVSASTIDVFVLKPNQNLHNQLPAKPTSSMQRKSTAMRATKSADTSFADDFDDIASEDLASLVALDEVQLIEQPKRRAPQNGLKQMTIFGQAATQELSTSQTAKKKHSWPVKARDEPPTHHELDGAAVETFTYPTNLGSIRDYQFNIVSRSLLHNTLVALPTGLGKTFIAATIMLNYYRWTTKAQIVFMAPTKPLIAQQMEACYGIVGIPRRDTVLMTGETQPAIRAEEWLDRRVFFMTPQTIINDLKKGICDPKRLVLVVVDEAHKATGGYAYTEVIKFLQRFNTSFRVLALTATPGSSVEAVQAVIDNLGIARVELRTEASLDIRQYTHDKQTEVELFDLSEEQTLIMDHISKAIQPVLDKLTSQNAYWNKDPMTLTAFGCTTARQKWNQSEAGKKASFPIKGMVNSIFVVLASLAHTLSLLKFHGISIFYSEMTSFQKKLDEEKGQKKYAKQIFESADFVKAMNYMRGWCNNIDFVGHPKMEYLRDVVANHFLDAGDGRHDPTQPTRATRVMIFSSWRSSTTEICRVLKRSEPLVRPHEFVGQSASKNSEGMDQKTQSRIIKEFKEGVYNVLVATSIGEEGLDIGDVDLIICYDGSASPIRMLQRIGRTARKRAGRVVSLLVRGKEENDYAKAQDSYAFVQKTIADDSRYSYRDDQSPRILPKGVSPVANKQVVDIPSENSQPIDLNERARRQKGKKKAKCPAKKFFMPDGVRTGFVKASAINSDSDDDSDDGRPVRRAIAKIAKKTTVKPKVVTALETAPIPFLADVLLTPAQLRDHERRFTRASDDGEAVIEAPDPSQNTDAFRQDQPTQYIARSRASKLYSSVLSNIHMLDKTRLDCLRRAEGMSSDELQQGITARLSGLHSISAVARTNTDECQATNVTRKCAPQKTAKPAHKAGKSEVEDAPGADKQARRARTKAKPHKTKQARHVVARSDSIDGSESSPEPTPADMRIATQGIDLGSRDTSGEDEEEQADSELEDFVVNSDHTIDMATSSVPMEHEFSSSIRQRQRGPRKRLARRAASAEIFDSDVSEVERELPVEEPESGIEASSDSDVRERGTSKVAPRKTRIVSDSESDE